MTSTPADHIGPKMRILCLHGVGTNAKVLQTQLAPTAYGMRAAGHNVDFHYINGPVETAPVKGVAELYEGPYYRFYGSDVPHINEATELAQCITNSAMIPEDWCRTMRDKGQMNVSSSEACDALENELRKHPAGYFDGVLGFSEGASLAASFMMSEANKKSVISGFKFAIFICAPPPISRDHGGFLLADEVNERIDIPTAHIYGSQDPGHKGSLALYALCSQAKASLFDHKAGHAIPWLSEATQGIVTAIMTTIQRTQNKRVDEGGASSTTQH